MDTINKPLLSAETSDKAWFVKDNEFRSSRSAQCSHQKPQTRLSFDERSDVTLAEYKAVFQSQGHINFPTPLLLTLTRRPKYQMPTSDEIRGRKRSLLPDLVR